MSVWREIESNVSKPPTEAHIGKCVSLCREYTGRKTTSPNDKKKKIWVNLFLCINFKKQPKHLKSFAY